MSPLTRQPLLGIFRVVSFSSFVLFSWSINQSLMISKEIAKIFVLGGSLFCIH